MIRIILLLDSYTIQAWQFELVKSLKECGVGQIVACVINQNPKASGAKSPFLYRLYRGLDRKLFLKSPDAFARKNLLEIENWDVPTLEIAPIQKKYSDFFPAEAIAKIKSYHPDVIIRLGFRILRGEILNAAPLGVWSFHHGDNQFYKGGPPAFWEVMLKKETTGVILQRLSEKLDDGQILYKSFFQTDPLSVQRNANAIFWNSSFMIASVIRQIETMGLEKWAESLAILQHQENTKIPLLSPPGTWAMAQSWVKLWARNLRRKLVEQAKKPYWELLVAENGEDSLSYPSQIVFQPIPPPKEKLSKGSFWADPFPIKKGGKTWVFFEAFDGKSQKGKIAVAEWNGSLLSDPQTILEEDWHLSYPFIWEENNETYLIPESGAAGNTFIYQAVEFPFRWRKIGLLLEGEAYDPTVMKVDNQYWLFVNQRPHAGASAFEELYAYHSPSLINPTWTGHALNPIVSDVRSARPAGRIFQRNGKWYRPAQDSGLRYGHRIKIQEILKLTPTEYAEKTTAIIAPDASKEILGTHTFNFTDRWIFSDAYSKR